MANLFVGDIIEIRRGKGNRRTRFIPTKTVIRGGKKKRSFNEIAIRNLANSLKKSNMPQKVIEHYTGIMRYGNQNRFINMSVFAETIRFIEDYGEENVLENESLLSYKNFLPYIDNILIDKADELNISNQTPSELKIIKSRLSATFLRNIRYYINVKDIHTKQTNKDKGPELERYVYEF